MTVSIFDLFSVGIGPSSSHTVGPMKAAYEFVSDLPLDRVERVQVDLYGSLALTGRGHATDSAILTGLEGNLPDKVIPEKLPERTQQILAQRQLHLGGKKIIPF